MVDGPNRNMERSPIQCGVDILLFIGVDVCVCVCVCGLTLQIN